MNYSIVVLGGIMLFSIIYYYFPKYGGVHWFKGPIRTIGNMDPNTEERAGLGKDEEVEKEKGEMDENLKSPNVKVEATESG